MLQVHECIHIFTCIYMPLCMHKHSHTHTRTHRQDTLHVYLALVRLSATHCNTRPYTATQYIKHTLSAPCCNTLHHTFPAGGVVLFFCNTLQHTATHCNTLHRTATHSHCKRRSALLFPAMHSNTLQHTLTHCNTHSLQAA